MIRFVDRERHVIISASMKELGQGTRFASSARTLGDLSVQASTAEAAHKPRREHGDGSYPMRNLGGYEFTRAEKHEIDGGFSRLGEQTNVVHHR